MRFLALGYGGVCYAIFFAAFLYLIAFVGGDMIPLLTGKLPENAPRDRFRKLAALEGVKEYPSRVKCASLCWHTLDAALKNAGQPVTTE